MKNNNTRIPYLDINENFYIEDDDLKMRLIENKLPKQGSWDDLWSGVLEIIDKVQEYDEMHNQNNNF